MKWYFASRTRHIEKLITISKFLESKKEAVLSEWVYEGDLMPFQEKLLRVQKLAAVDISGVLKSDVFVLISDPAGTDMFAELGAALAKDTLTPGSIRIYIVGEHAKRSLMQLHPAIMHIPTLKDVFEKEKIDSEGFEIPELS